MRSDLNIQRSDWLQPGSRFAVLGATLAICLWSSAALGQHEGHEGHSAIQKPVVFLDKSPKIVAYQLNRLSNAQLLLVDRRTTDAKYIPVYEAIASRPGVDAKNREDALKALAVLNKSDETAEMVAAIKRTTGDKAGPAIHALGKLLVSRPADDLKKHRAVLETLAAEGAQDDQRRAAYAALAASLPPDDVWSTAAGKPSGQALLLSSLPQVPDGSKRAAYFGRVQPLLGKAPDAAVHASAVAAAASMPGHEAEVFGALTKLFTAGTERVACVRGIQVIPKDKWPEDQLQPLADAILQHAPKVPAKMRTENDYLDLIQLGKDVAAKLPKDQGSKVRKTLAGLGVNVIRIRTLHEQMFYDKTRIVVEAGKPVEIIFENPDVMPHNLVIVAPGALEEIGMKAEQMSPIADSQGQMYVPASPKVLQATKLLEPGEKTKLSFNAPSKADAYPYVCTFPGHWRRMNGVMIVVDDLEAYLAQAPAEPAAPVMTEWKMSDLVPELAKVKSGRNHAKGRELFTAMGCSSCHQLGAEGVPFGPNLTGVLQKYKGDPAAVLGEIMEPSKHIEPRYQNHNFTLAGGDVFNGLVVKEEGGAMFVQTGPSEALIQKVEKKSIKSQEPQPMSLMPAGLLNLLTKEQILDLVAYVLAGGDAQHASFKP